MSDRDEMIEVIAEAFSIASTTAGAQSPEPSQSPKAFPPVLLAEIPEHRIATERDEARELLRVLVTETLAFVGQLAIRQDGGSPDDLDVARRLGRACDAARIALKDEERTHLLVPRASIAHIRRFLVWGVQEAASVEDVDLFRRLTAAIESAAEGRDAEWPT